MGWDGLGWIGEMGAWNIGNSTFHSPQSTVHSALYGLAYLAVHIPIFTFKFLRFAAQAAAAGGGEELV